MPFYKKHLFSGWFLLIPFLWISCSKPQPVRFTGYRNFQFNSQGFSSGILKADLALYNPNPYPMKIRNAHVKVFINKKALGDISQDSLLVMPAKDTFLMPIQVQFNLLDLAGKLLSAAGSDSILLEATGSCKVGRSGIFVNLPLHYKSKEALNLF